MQDEEIMRFKVLYRPNHARHDTVRDWLCKDFTELLTALEREGITKETAKYLYVHYTQPNQDKITEVIVWSTDTDKGKTADSNKKTAKPRVRIVSPCTQSECVVAATPVVNQGLYKAYGGTYGNIN